MQQQTQPQNVQWVNVSPQQPTPPPGRNRRTTVLVIIGSVVALVLLVVFIVSIIRTISIGGGRMSEEVEDQIARALQDCEQEENVERCKSLVVQELAEENGSAEYCRYLEDQMEVDCVLMAAIGAEDVQLCQQISADEDARAMCNDAVLSLTAQPSSVDINACSQYMQDENRQQCVEARQRRAMLQENCRTLGIENELCDIGEQIRAAMNAQDPDLCDLISENSWREYCRQLTEPGDRDFDGVDEATEAYYGTDDRKADTDGDGFDDKTEIENGFDPLS